VPRLVQAVRLVQTWWRHWALLVHAATAAGLELLRPEVAKAQEVRRKEHARQRAAAAAPVRFALVSAAVDLTMRAR
jgi:hypothetical protein